MTGIIDGRLKDATEAVEWEKALKAIVEVTTREKGEAAVASERKEIDAKKARQTSESKLTIMEKNLGETELKLATANSLNLAQADQIVELKESLEACEDKWYNAGFSEAERSMEPIIPSSKPWIRERVVSCSSRDGSG